MLALVYTPGRAMTSRTHGPILVTLFKTDNAAHDNGMHNSKQERLSHHTRLYVSATDTNAPWARIYMADVI